MGTMPDTATCDRCETVIVREPWENPYVRNFRVQVDTKDGKPVYENTARELCHTCEEDMLAWIDGEYSREGAVELPDGIKSGEILRRYADELDDLADSIEAELEL